jgi:hypothetical protein
MKVNVLIVVVALCACIFTHGIFGGVVGIHDAVDQTFFFKRL